MGLQKDLQQETVSTMPLRPALTVKRGTPVRLVVAEMKTSGLGAAIVVDDQRKPVGIFTERLLVRMLAVDASRLDHPIDDHMVSVNNLVVKLDDPVIKVIEAMQSTGIRFVCVVDDDGRVRSLTGIRGVLEYTAEHFPRAVKVQGLEAKYHMDEREGA